MTYQQTRHGLLLNLDIKNIVTLTHISRSNRVKFSLSTILRLGAVNGEEKLGFANYVRHRIMSVDRRYCEDYIYLFFLLFSIKRKFYKLPSKYFKSS